MVTKNGRPVYSYIARFTRRDTFDRVISETRPVRAVNDYQAEKKALGIAASNGWRYVNVGRA